MSKGIRRGAVMLALVTLASVATSPAAATDEETTVGRFVVELAKAKKLTATDARVAAASLADVGVELPKELDFEKRLTEGDVVLLARAAGLNVSSTDPDRPFDAEQVDRFFLAFSAELSAARREGIGTRDDGSGHPGPGTVPPGFDPFTKGKKKSTPKEPE